MSFVPLDRVDFSREDSLQATPVRIRAIGRCKSPVPASEHSFDATPRERQPFSQAPSNASRIQPTPSHQPSIPRHRRAGDDLLRTLNESVTDLRDELHNKSQSGETLATERIADLCRKLDVIASVVLRHERELKSQSTLVDHLSAAKPSHNRDETSELMTSILMKVNEVNSMVSGAPRPKSVARMHETSQTSMSADLATPLYRIAEALDSVTKEVQRQHVTIERLAKAQLEREEDERIATAMAIRPPSVISASTEDPHRAFTHRMRLAAEELPAREIQTPSYHSNSRTSAIAPNEESPRRMRHYEAPSGEIEASADELTLPEGDLDPSPARMRFAPRFESEEASPPRQRQARQLPVEGSTVAAKTVFDVSIQRTVSKQPEYLVRGASAQKLSSRKPVCRPDIFDTSSNSSAATPVRLNETQSDHDTLIQQLMRENESLKDQLYHQLQKYDDLRSVVHESSPRGRGRSFVSATVF